MIERPAPIRVGPVIDRAPLIERIHEVARHLATWQPTTVGWSPEL